MVADRQRAVVARIPMGNLGAIPVVIAVLLLLIVGFLWLTERMTEK